jgi:GNAT superfamily N-acetyltransferase
VDAVVDREGLRTAAAANVAAWHDSSVRSLHARSQRRDGWWSYAAAAPNIYFTAISLAAQPDDAGAAALAFVRRHLEDPDGGYVCVCDSWDELALEDLGLARRTRGRWCVRPGAALPSADEPDDLVIEHVRDRRSLAAFEATMVRGFGARFPLAPFEIHAPGVLDDPSMHVLLGRHRDEPVAVSMAYETEGMLGVYGVATIDSARGCGFATAMTRAALAVDPLRTAMLQPTVEAWPIYQRLGFVDIGSFSNWG